jgi:carbamoyl-phosphate synthase large subunit
MRILITAIGGDIAQSIAKIIKLEALSTYLIGSDNTLSHPGHFFVDEVITLPRGDDPSYLEVLGQRIKSLEIDYVIPVNEKEIYALSSIMQTPESIIDYDKFILPKSEGFLNFFDKLETITFLNSLDVKIELPWTISSSEKPLEFPCIYKPLKQSGSKGIEVVTREKYEVMTVSSDGVFQQLLGPSDQEYTCGVYRSRNNNYDTQIVILKRLLRGGLTGYAEVVQESQIYRYCLEIADSIKLQGSINIQLINSANGPKLFEINPRFSSTVIFRNHIGFKDLAWSVLEKAGNKYEIGYSIEKSVGQKFYRVYTELYE